MKPEEIEMKLYAESLQLDMSFLELEVLQVKDEITMLKRKLTNLENRKLICAQQQEKLLERMK